MGRSALRVMSSSTTNRGMLPKPKPARRNACFTQVREAPDVLRMDAIALALGELRAIGQHELHVLLELVLGDDALVPRQGMRRGDDVTMGTSISGSLFMLAGATGNVPITPIWQVPCNTGSMTAPSASTYSRSGV